jgi:hypothetical protein
MQIDALDHDEAPVQGLPVHPAQTRSTDKNSPSQACVMKHTRFLIGSA